MDQIVNTISAIVLIHRDSKQLTKCLQSLAWVDELILIDSRSGPVPINKFAHLHPNVRIFTRLLDTFSNQRNFGLSKASGTWVLHCDSDEIISEALSVEIITKVKNINSKFCAYNAKLEFYWKTKRLSFIDGPKGFGAILHKKDCAYFVGDVHERLTITGPTGLLSSPVCHVSEEDVLDRATKAVTYARKETSSVESSPIRDVSIVSVFWPPVKRFLGFLIVKRAYRDGMAGIIWAALESYALFLRRANIWSIHFLSTDSQKTDNMFASSNNRSIF